MNVQLDLILPPVVVGILLLLVLSLNTRMMESQVDHRLQTDMQAYANSAMDAMQERFRDIQTVLAVTDTTLRYVSVDYDTVNVFRRQRDLLFRSLHGGPGGAPDTTVVPARVSDLRFNMILLNPDGPAMLRVRVESRSLATEEVAGSPSRQRGFAEREFYLRNIQFSP